MDTTKLRELLAERSALMTAIKKGGTGHAMASMLGRHAELSHILANSLPALLSELDEVRRERDAAFAMSRCECASDECCANLVAAQARAERAESERAALRAAVERAEERIDRALHWLDRYDAGIDDSVDAMQSIRDELDPQVGALGQGEGT